MRLKKGPLCFSRVNKSNITRRTRLDFRSVSTARHQNSGDRKHERCCEVAGETSTSLSFAHIKLRALSLCTYAELMHVL